MWAARIAFAACRQAMLAVLLMLRLLWLSAGEGSEVFGVQPSPPSVQPAHSASHWTRSDGRNRRSGSTHQKQVKSSGQRGQRKRGSRPPGERRRARTTGRVGDQQFLSTVARPELHSRWQRCHFSRNALLVPKPSTRGMQQAASCCQRLPAWMCSHSAALVCMELILRSCCCVFLLQSHAPRTSDRPLLSSSACLLELDLARPPSSAVAS